MLDKFVADFIQLVFMFYKNESERRGVYVYSIVDFIYEQLSAFQ